MKKKGKSKVLMIGPARSVHGGVSAVVNNLYEAGLSRQVQLKYIATMVDGSKARKLLQAGIAYVGFLAALPFYQILHVNMAADASCYRKKIFIDTADFFKKKILIHEHGGDFEGFYFKRCSEKQRASIKKSMNRADVFLVLSDSWKNFFGKIVDKEKIHVLQNRILIPKKGKKNYSSRKILFLGRLCREKGIGELLETVPVIQKQIPDVKFILGGLWEAGNEELKKKAESLSDVVELPGWVSPEERERLIEECSIFVLPTWFEGQPVSLLEAMAAGMCVVTTKVGGIPQIMGEEKGQTGILLPPKDTKALADTLTWLLNEEETRKGLGEQARSRMVEQYDISSNVKALVRYYETLKG